MQSRNWNFIKKGLPFFVFIGGSIVGLTYIQQIRYDYSETKHKKIAINTLQSELQKKGVALKEKPQSVEEIYSEFDKKGIWDKDYKNVRGPHVGEINKEWDTLISDLKSKKTREGKH